jgi:hypothetical protein
MRRQAPGALLVALCLFAPARAQDTTSPPSEATPAAITSHVYELVLRRGAPYIELALGGARGLFLVDTGANTSNVDRGWLEQSGAAWRQGRATTVGGTTGAIRRDTCVIDRLDLGTAFFRDVGLTLTGPRAPAPGATRPQVGLLGTDLLNRYQASFDWVHSRLELRLRGERRPVPPGHEPVACAYPIGLPTVGTRLSGLGLPCRLDTGATYLDQTPRLDVNVATVDALRARGVKLVPAGSITVRGISGVERLEVLAGEGPDGLVLDLGPARIERVLLVVHGRGTLAVDYPLALASATLLARLNRLVFDPFDHLLWVPVPEPRQGERLGPL